MTKCTHRRSVSRFPSPSGSVASLITAVALALGLAVEPSALPVNAAPSGTLVAWGLNDYGQTTVPAGLSGVTGMAGGFWHTVAVTANGQVIAWGRNDYGQATVPTRLSPVVAVAAGQLHTVALTANGQVIAWGQNLFGQTTVPAAAQSGVVAIAAGGYHNVALKSDGTVVAWGINAHGERNVPAGLSGVVAIAAGTWHTMALKNNGAVVAWGLNDNGQTTVPTGLIAVAIAAGGHNSVALRSDSTVACWGRAIEGQTVVPNGLNGVVAVAAGGEFTVALKNNGTVITWGRYYEGQTNVPAGLSGVTAIAAGGWHTLALAGNGAPVAHCKNVTVSAGANCSANASIDDGSFDPDAGDTITLQQTPAGPYPMGVTQVTLTVTDNHGASASSTATVTVKDTEKPVLVGMPADAIVECDAVPGPALVTAVDNCDAASTVSFNEARLEGGCSGSYILKRTWTAKDASGNTSSLTQTISVQDTKASVITKAAADLTVECDGADNTTSLNAWLTSHGGASAVDTCSQVTWTHNFTALSDGCGETGSAKVTFTATDACGNSSGTTATFAIIDTTAPALTWKINNVAVDNALVANITPNQVPVTITVSAADICGPAFLNPLRVTCLAINGAGKIVDKSGSCVIEISGGTVKIIDSGGVGTFITIFASAIDECGNSTGEKQLVIEVKNPGARGSGGTKGNEGVGNGVDGNTPGHDNNGGNDDPGSSPGNSGAKNKN